MVKEHEASHRILALVGESIDVAPNEIDLELELDSDYGLDSLGLADLRDALEEEFQIVVLDEEIDEMVSAQQIIKLIESKLH